MKSKIKFGLGDQNAEIIIGHVVKSTDDVRDRIASGFVESFGNNSNICYYSPSPAQPGEKTFELYPVQADLESCKKLISRLPIEQINNLFVAAQEYLESITIKTP